MNPRLRLALALAGLTVGMINFALLLRFRHDLDAPLAYLLIRVIGVSGSFVTAGLVAWSRRPANSTGALMVAVGLTWSVYGLGVLQYPVVFALWFVLASVPDAVLGHLIAVFPDGRANTRLQRVFVLANYAGSVPLAVLLVLAVSPDQLGCAGCPKDLLGLGDGYPVGDVVLAASSLTKVLLVALLFRIVLTRWRHAQGPRRRSLAPVALVGLGLVSAYMVRQAFPAAWPNAPRAIPAGLDLTILIALLLWPLAFVAGLARLRLDRSTVGDLAVRLSGPLTPNQLEQALADSLHDRSLRLAYWLPDRQTFVDVAGRPITLPAETDERAVTVLRHDGRTVAALLHHASLADDPVLVRAVAATASATIENERLHAEVRAQLVEVRESRARIIEAADAARSRVERDLHDGAQQRLVNLSLALGIAWSEVRTAPRTELAGTLDQAVAEVRLALAELRELARGIYPLILTEAGLGPALTSLAERSPIAVEVAAVPSDRLSRRVEETAYFVASETLANAAKHARATTVTIAARRLDGQLIVEVDDDGVGGADPSGSGLRGLADRLAALDGHLQVASAVGEGTRITARLPCA